MVKKIGLGFLIGLVAPCLIVSIIYIFKYSDYEVLSYLETSYRTGLLEKKLSLGAILNLGIFMLTINLKRELIARGIFLATLCWGAYIVYLKFFV